MPDGNFEDNRPRQWQLLSFDHLVVACDDLASGAAWVTERLGGVAPEPHGDTARFLALGAGEFIAVVSAQDGGVPRFGPGAPRLAAWGLSAATVETALERTRLRGVRPMRTAMGGQTATVAARADGALPCDGLFPMLTAWHGMSPGVGLPDRGCRLSQITVSHPEAERIWRALTLSDMRVELLEGPPGLQAVIETPNGFWTLG